MNNLALVKALQEEGGAGSTPVTTLVGATGETLRMRNWIDNASTAIQSLWTDWKFLWVEGAEITTGIGTADYVGPDALKEWDYRSFKVDGTIITDVQEYDVQEFPSAAASGTPSSIYILPNNQIRVYPTPDAAYTITADYWQVPVSMLDAGDIDAATPLIPAPFHRAIVYYALEQMGKWENAQELVSTAQSGLEVWMPLLEASQLPGHRAGAVSNGNEITIRAE